MYTHRWVFPAIVKRVIDGDTFELMLDMGMDTWKREVVRLNRIDAYEITLRAGTTPEEKEKGLAGKAFLEAHLQGKLVYVETFREGKYGRYIAEVSCDPNYFSTGSTIVHTWFYEGTPDQFRLRIGSTEDRNMLLNINDEMVRLGYAIYREY